MEIQIRSHTFMTESSERNYGEYIFYYLQNKPHLLPLNADKLNSYRLFEGKGTLCSKSLAFPLNKGKVAVLFLKENRPNLDELTLQIFDLKTAEPLEVIETNYLTDTAELSSDGFYFQTYVERLLGSELGKIKINGETFVYQDRDFSYWMKYSLKGFEVMPQVSYQKSNWAEFFKDEKDFLHGAGWDESEKKFKNTVVYVAVNHKLKKECLLMVPRKLALSGLESDWRCK